MATNPFLLFREPKPSARIPRGGGGPLKTVIESTLQHGRISRRLQRLQKSIENAELTSGMDGEAPDLVIVLEAREKVSDVAKAAQSLGLAVIQEEEFEGMEFDDIEREALKERDTTFGKGALYLTIGDGASRKALLSSFESYQKGEHAPSGLTPLWRLFSTLHDVRVWNVSDRVSGTGLGRRLVDLRANGDERARLEIELWYRRDGQHESARDLWVENVGASAKVLHERVIEEIAYHGLLIEVDIDDAIASKMLEPDDNAPRWAQDSRVRAVRPAAQFVTSKTAAALDDEELFEPHVPGTLRTIPNAPTSTEPLVAVLDGLPQAAHPILAGWVQLDDPEGWGSTVESHLRQHGTAMCSIVCHGDLYRAGQSLSRPIYARPIMRPVASWRPGREQMPDDRLAVDVLEEAVLRLVRERPSIRVINLSIGDEGAVHLRQASPLARLVDYLAWQHGLLFVISAGNRADNVTLHGVPLGGLSSSTRDARHAAAMTCLAREAVERRIRPPAEALNALTVGASHDDCSGNVDGRANRYELVVDGAPSPISAHGPGLNRSVKPDVLLPGGRMIYREPMIGTSTGVCVVETLDLPGLRSAPPGNVVARPGVAITNGQPTTGFSWGTSDAAAYASHLAGLFLENLDERIENLDPDDLDANTTACLAKALVAHHAEHGAWHKDLLSEYAAFPRHGLELASRVAGNGVVDPERAMANDRPDNCATLVAFGYVRKDGILTYEFPVPDEIQDVSAHRRLTVTLASLVPTTARRSQYRPHWVEVDVSSKSLKSFGFESRINNDYRAARRGTLQHDSWETRKNRNWENGASIAIEVTGRSHLEITPGPMPFVLIASLVVDDPQIAVYQSVRARVKQPIRISRVGVR